MQKINDLENQNLKFENNNHEFFMETISKLESIKANLEIIPQTNNKSFIDISQNDSHKDLNDPKLYVSRQIDHLLLLSNKLQVVYNQNSQFQKIISNMKGSLTQLEEELQIEKKEKIKLSSVLSSEMLLKKNQSIDNTSYSTMNFDQKFMDVSKFDKSNVITVKHNYRENKTSNLDNSNLGNESSLIFDETEDNKMYIKKIKALNVH